MPDEIYENRFVGIEHAWHQKGTLIEDGTSTERAMELAGMSNWDIKWTSLDELSDWLDGKGLGFLTRKVMLKEYNDDGTVNHEFEGREVLGETMVEQNYRVISNEELFIPMVEMMTGMSLPVDAAGVLGKFGNRAFMTFRAGRVEMPGNEVYEKFLVALANHTGQDACRILGTGIRVVCANTERAAVQSARNFVAIPHNAVSLQRFYDNPESGRAMLQLSHNYEHALIQMMEKYQEKPFTDNHWKLAMQRFFSEKDRIDTLKVEHIRDRQRESLDDMWALESHRAQVHGQEQTLWTARQAVSTYVQHKAYGQRANRAISMAVGNGSPLFSTLMRHAVSTVSA